MSVETSEIQRRFEYGRNLYVSLFRDETPFISLGFTPKHRGLARRALSQLENEGQVMLKPTPCAVFTEIDPKNPAEDKDIVFMRLLKHGGYNIQADVPIPDFDLDSNDIHSTLRNHISRLEELTFFEADKWGTVVVMRMLPQTVDLTNMDLLVKHLYQGSEKASDNVNLEPDSLLTRIKAPFLPRNAIYRATWVDDNTKLDLIVETDFQDKDFKEKDPEKYIDLWRRLPEIEHEGQVWIPFGKKPNSSNKNAKLAFEAKGKRVMIGNLATETSQIAT